MAHEQLGECITMLGNMESTFLYNKETKKLTYAISAKLFHLL